MGAGVTPLSKAWGKVSELGTVFAGQMAQARDLGKGVRAMTCLKTLPILRQEKVNVKVIYLLEGRGETGMALGGGLEEP